MGWNPFKAGRGSEDLTRTDPTSDDLSLHAIWPQVDWFNWTVKGMGFSPRLIQRVWVANRCLQLTCQQIAAMPLRYLGNQAPAWVTNPDPVWYPNGISDAVFAIAWSMYGWGDAFVYTTSRYASGLVSGWTVLDPAMVQVNLVNGTREYRANGIPLNPEDVTQISRNPHGALRGTSALAAYGSYMWGALASAELSRELIGENPVPQTVLKSLKKLTPEQALAVRTAWGEASRTRGALPAILPPDLDLEKLAFSPRDLLLLDAQEYTARMIASAFNVPAFLLNLPLVGGLTYQNPDMLFDVWHRVELRPGAKRISDALSAQMLPRGSSVHFDASEIVRPALPDWHRIWKEALEDGAVNIDEYRQAVLQLGPMTDGTAAVDELLQPASAGASPAQQPAADVVPIIRPSVMSN